MRRFSARGISFLELQDHGLREQKYVNPQLIRLSRELDIPLVATNDCHYITREDSEMHRILLCIQTKPHGGGGKRPRV